MRRRRGLDQLELVARAQAGERDAVEQLLAETEGLVRKMAHKRLGTFTGLELEDLVQVGLLGILSALETFDLGRGVAFSTHAVWKVRSEFSKARRLDGLIHLPEHAVRAAAGREGYPALPRVTQSLDEPLHDGDDGHLIDRIGDIIPADDDTEAEVLAELEGEWPELRRLVNQLPYRWRQAVTLLYGLEDGIPRTLEEVGLLLGLSKQGVRHRCERACRRLRVELRKSERNRYRDGA